MTFYLIMRLLDNRINDKSLLYKMYSKISSKIKSLHRVDIRYNII